MPRVLLTKQSELSVTASIETDAPPSRLSSRPDSDPGPTPIAHPARKWVAITMTS